VVSYAVVASSPHIITTTEFSVLELGLGSLQKYFLNLFFLFSFSFIYELCNQLKLRRFLYLMFRTFCVNNVTTVLLK
jgi:hypothetical protein